MTNGVPSGDDESTSSEAPVTGDDEVVREARGDDAAALGGEAREAHPGDYDPLRAVVAAARQHATVGVPLIVIAAMLVAGKLYGPSAGVLVLAGAALAAAIGTFWTSVRALVGETALSSEDAFALGAPSAEEEQKRAVLRAIKDIEFERSVGKLAEDDFAALHARYRAEAKRLLSRIDEGARPQRARVEALVQRRLAEVEAGKDQTGKEQAGKDQTGKEQAGKDQAGKDQTGKDQTGKEQAGKDQTGKDQAGKDQAGKDQAGKGEAAPEKRGKSGKASPRAAGQVRPRCGACGAKNDDDARFCKGCGKAMRTKEAT